jgi:hypothetical protein
MVLNSSKITVRRQTLTAFQKLLPDLYFRFLTPSTFSVCPMVGLVQGGRGAVDSRDPLEVYTDEVGPDRGPADLGESEADLSLWPNDSNK